MTQHDLLRQIRKRELTRGIDFRGQVGKRVWKMA